MKTLMALVLVGAAGVATLGFSARVDARPARTAHDGPTDAQVEAALDARQREVLGALLESQRSSGRMASLPR